MNLPNGNQRARFLNRKKRTWKGEPSKNMVNLRWSTFRGQRNSGGVFFCFGVGEGGVGEKGSLYLKRFKGGTKGGGGGEKG